MTTAMLAMHADLARCGALVGAPEHRWRRIAVVFGTLVLLAAAGSWAGAPHRLQIAPEHARLFDAMIGVALVAYVLAMAVPFVPGIEIGLALMMVLGDQGVLLVYAATQCSLAVSFLLGRWVPARLVGAAFRWLGMERAARLLQSIAAMPSAQQAEYLARSSTGRWAGLLARRPGLALAVALNLPGNALIGGGGGIGMIAGMSRLFPTARYLLVVAVATSPVPVFLLLSGAA